MEILIVYQTEADGEMKIISTTEDLVPEITKHWHWSDYAVIKGQIIKDFDQKDRKSMRPW